MKGPLAIRSSDGSAFSGLFFSFSCAVLSLPLKIPFPHPFRAGPGPRPLHPHYSSSFRQITLIHAKRHRALVVSDAPVSKESKTCSRNCERKALYSNRNRMAGAVLTRGKLDRGRPGSAQWQG